MPIFKPLSALLASARRCARRCRQRHAMAEWSVPTLGGRVGQNPYSRASKLCAGWEEGGMLR